MSFTTSAFPIWLLQVVAISACILASSVMAQELPATDRRTTELRHLDLKYDFQPYASRDAWERRAGSLRNQILFAAGLLPQPQKTALNSRVFGKVDKGDYTVEKVYFESYPGHYVTGNLYRPKNATGKVPAVLCPHGHWAYGRLENQQLNSGPGRSANFARQGYVAFTWDMVGYNDSNAITHSFASHKKGLVPESLWGINLLGLQLWNSIRSVDFLLSLPDVDANRIGITGESGGGTQTFLLSAVDDRIKLSAPVNMISSTMQGGSVCENAPLLRIDTNNMEIAALMAPRPMMMIAATGDWTKLTPQIEYPAEVSIYKLYDAGESVKFAQFDLPHNYNQSSREAVYGWFGRWFMNAPDYKPIREKSGSIPAIPELLVFFGQPRPANELNERELTAALIAAREKQLADALPRKPAGVDAFKASYGKALLYSLMGELPNVTDLIASAEDSSGKVRVSRKGRGDLVEMKIDRPRGAGRKSVILIAQTDRGIDAETKALTTELVAAGHTVALMTCFEGRTNQAEAAKFDFLTTYNRTDAANRVQDILTSIAYLNSIKGAGRLSVIGRGDAGLLALLARGLAGPIDGMLVDANAFDGQSSEAFLDRLAIPGIRRAGDFLTATAVAPLRPLVIHNTGGVFKTERLAGIYSDCGKASDFESRSERLSNSEIVRWLNRLSS